MIDAHLFLSVFVTLFVIMDPPGTVPVFLALTRTLTHAQRKRAAWQALAVAFGVIVGFALFGQQLLTYLHVSLPALQASGGLLLLLIAMQLLTGKDQGGVPDDVESGGNVALVPLGTPLLAGPGAIVATMVYVHQAGTGSDWVAIGVGVVLVHVCLYLAMRFAAAVHRVLGNSGTLLVSRIAGLLLAAIAAQMLADAIIAFARQV